MKRKPFVPPPDRCPVACWSQRCPDDTAVRLQNRSISYGALHAGISARVGVGRAWGLGTGDRVAVLAPNCLDTIIWLFAVLRLGAVIVPINLRDSETAWQETVTRSGCKALLYHDDLAAARRLFRLPGRPIQADGSDRADAAADDAVGHSDDVHPAAGADQPGTDSPEALIVPARDATLVFTSGSTGQARGIRLSYANHYYNALGSNRNILLHPGDSWMVSLPFYHVSGLAILFRAFVAGASVTLCRDGGAGAIHRVLQQGGVTHVSLVPAQLQALLAAAAGPDLARLTCILLGGAPAPADLLDAGRDLGLPICTTYGMTETASQITATAPDDPPDAWRSSGAPLAYREVAVADVHGDRVPAGQTGEILVRGEVVMSGTLTHTRTKREWLSTGDLGYLHGGRLWVLGRKDDLILSGGEKIYPAEIERIALEHPGVSACRAVAEEDPVWGQRPVLIVEAAAGATFSPGKLYEYLDKRLGRLKRPARIGRVTRLPRTATGKIDGAKLRQLIGSNDVNWHHERQP